MTAKELESRVLQLEKQVQQLEKRLGQPDPINPKGKWWRRNAGHFANDPIFDEIIRLGKQYRQSLHPDKKPKKRSRKK